MVVFFVVILAIHYLKKTSGGFNFIDIVNSSFAKASLKVPFFF